MTLPVISFLLYICNIIISAKIKRMDYAFYLNEFRLAAAQISKEEFESRGIRISIDIVLESAALKIYKPQWCSDSESLLKSTGRIFFSLWINHQALQTGRIYYNIHALKLRELKNYKIAGRDFAENFRNQFSKYQEDWPNVSIKYGPLTLMEGWIELKEDNLQKDTEELIQKFLKISPLIDKVLEQYKK